MQSLFSRVIACEQKLNQNLCFCSQECQQFPLAMQYNEQAELCRPDCCFSSETGVNGVFPELESRTLPKIPG